MRPGLPRRRTHDYVRHSTTTLFAALEIATGTVLQAAAPPPGVPGLPQQVARAHPDRELHVVMDNCATYKRTEVRDWLAAKPWVHVHFTPTSGSWLNLVEVWFSIIEKQAIHRGTFGSVKDLNAKIRSLHRRLERPLPPLRLDRDRRRNPQETKRPTTSATAH